MISAVTDITSKKKQCGLSFLFYFYVFFFFEGFSKALTKGICHKSCKGLGCLGLSLSKMIYFYFVVLYCNYLPQHCHSISSIKNGIPSDCAVLFVLHKLFPFCNTFSLCFRENMACRLGEFVLFCQTNARRSRSPLRLSTHAQTSFQPRWSRVRGGQRQSVSIATSNGFS